MQHLINVIDHCRETGMVEEAIAIAAFIEKTVAGSQDSTVPQVGETSWRTQTRN